jgi:DNA topoisomerase IB
MPIPQNDRELKKYKKEVGKAVGKQLGNSPTIALNSYVAPEVFCKWESTSPFPEQKEGKKRPTLTEAFLECVHYDREVPTEEKNDSHHLSNSNEGD